MLIRLMLQQPQRLLFGSLENNMLERIYIEIGNICNLSCSFCAGTKRTPRQMTKSEFETICKKIKGYTKYIYLHVMGEPLLHNDLSEILETAKKHSLKVCITTNGTLLQENGNILLNSNAVHKVSISLHSPEGNGITDFDSYLKNAVEFSKAAAEKGIYTVFRLWNGDSSEGLGKNTQNAYIESFLKSSFTKPWQERPKGFRLQKNIFLEYDKVFTWPSESNAEPISEGFCHGLSSQAAILVDGTVTPCCLDSDGAVSLGNIFESDFSDILNSPLALLIKDSFKSGKVVHSFCQKCTFMRKFKKRNN